MANLRDICPKEVNGEIVEYPLMVTITLEEYRWLIQENVYQNERISWLESEIDRLHDKIREFSAPQDCSYGERKEDNG